MPRIRAGDPGSEHIRVLVDGEELWGVIEVDTDEGWARCLIPYPVGATGPHSWPTAVCHGDITLEFDI